MICCILGSPLYARAVGFVLLGRKGRGSRLSNSEQRVGRWLAPCLA